MNQVSQNILKTLRYSDRFNFPLTKDEIKEWYPGAIGKIDTERNLKSLLNQRRVERSENYYFLPESKFTVKLRKARLKIGKDKWRVARRVGKWLQKIPTVQMIAITGSLAMNNSTPEDDIDLLVVTSANALWLTRPIIWVLLKSKNLRRAPLTKVQDQIKDKICDNLYFDSLGLTVSRPATEAQRLYISHEILQAKPIFDRSDLHSRFLAANQWVCEVLPSAYERKLKRKTPVPPGSSFVQELISLVSAPLNMLFFKLQFQYMHSKMTKERVSLHSAYFHPNAPLDTKPRHSLK